VGIGLGTPRPTIRLSKGENGVRLIEPRSGKDLTDAMVAWATRTADDLAGLGVNGLVLKKDSPSCGVERVKVHPAKEGGPQRDGVGVFAMVFMALNPQIPVIEEGRLNDPNQAEHFLARVHFHHRWQSAGQEGWTAQRLMAFHQEHKIFLVARTADAKRKLGRTIAAGFDAGLPASEVALKYMIEAQGHLNVLPRRGRFAHAMERALSRMDLALSSPRREEVIRSIHAYRKGHLPRMAPLLLLDHLAGSDGAIPPWLGHLSNPVPAATGVLAKV
jgi:uncharacterized protein YbbK (DUF523 family)/uncharacterized protein YbgA (DUF1722 family)